MSRNNGLSLIRALEATLLCHTFENKGVFSSQLCSQPHADLGGCLGLECTCLSGGIAWFCIEDRLLSNYYLWFPSSYSDISSSLLLFLPTSALTSLFFCSLLQLMSKSMKKISLLLFLLCKRNMECCEVSFPRSFWKDGRHWGRLFWEYLCKINYSMTLCYHSMAKEIGFLC